MGSQRADHMGSQSPREPTRMLKQTLLTKAAELNAMVSRPTVVATLNDGFN